MTEYKKDRFQQFAKTKKKKRVATTNAVIYTRVSTKEQMTEGASLEAQLLYTKAFAIRKGYSVVGYFGGTYESAKSDERVEFNKMLKFLRTHKNVSYIIVLSYDRFSRTGANAIYINSKLRDQGVHVLSAQQEVNVHNPAGEFQQNLYYIFSQFDNEMRKEKTVTGQTAKLRAGYWVWSPPRGYKKTNMGARSEEAIFEITKEGKLLQKAFQWIYKHGWTISRAVEELGKRDMKIGANRLAEYLRNPFYAGLIVCKLIPDEVIQGKHKPLVSPEVFLEVNAILDGKNVSRKGIKMHSRAEEVFMKGLLYCDECGKKMSSYLGSDRMYLYYKCRTKGCKNNQRVEQVHKNFEEVLKLYKLQKENLEPLKLALQESIYEMNKDLIQKMEVAETKVKEIDSKLEKVEEKYIFDEISKDVYQKFKDNLQKERATFAKELDNPLADSSRIAEAIEVTANIGVNLLNTWNSGSYEERASLVNLLFPDGIKYNRKKQIFRESRVNSMFVLTSMLSGSNNDNEPSNCKPIGDLSAQVCSSEAENTIKMYRSLEG